MDACSGRRVRRRLAEPPPSPGERRETTGNAAGHTGAGGFVVTEAMMHAAASHSRSQEEPAVAAAAAAVIAAWRGARLLYRPKGLCHQVHGRSKIGQARARGLPPPPPLPKGVQSFRSPESAVLCARSNYPLASCAARCTAYLGGSRC
jgi:hypothetical protein